MVTNIIFWYDIQTWTCCYQRWMLNPNYYQRTRGNICTDICRLEYRSAFNCNLDLGILSWFMFMSSARRDIVWFIMRMSKVRTWAE